MMIPAIVVASAVVAYLALRGLSGNDLAHLMDKGLRVVI